jgi:two-component system sensor histidine kinase GlrK
MRWVRPKSLSSLMLLGLVLAAVPLAIAVVDASIQMRELATSSQQLVLRGVEATRSTQALLTGIASLERTARLYSVLADPKLLDSYAQNDDRVSATREALSSQLDAAGSRATLASLARMQQELRSALPQTPPATPAFEQLLGRYGTMSELATWVADSGNAQLDAELITLKQKTENARERLFWQSALLVPLTLAVVLVVIFWIGRPLRAIDRAIGELGRGTFSHPIAVSGPEDLERLGRQLEWLRQRLLELAQERNRFLRHMSHELKTPLANIREGTELLMDGAVGELQSGQREVTSILRDNGIRLQRLIENLLSFSAWQTQSLGLELSEFRLRPLVKQVIENQQITLLAQRLRLDVKIDDLTIYGDRGKLRLILENLLSNAIKYSPRGGTIYLHCAAAGDAYVLDVADCGPGIPREDRARIFDAFYTGKPAGGHVKGTGIGLSVVMEFVSVQGGSIEIVDGQYPGAHFRVRLPLRTENRSDGITLERARAA